MKTFVLNIGNTHTQHGFYENGEIRQFQYCLSSELDSGVIPDGVPVAAATVVPAMRSRLDRKIFWITASAVKALKLDVIDTSTVGADRLANAVALAENADLPAICVDCGTAVTFDVVDRNRRYYGGAISPGRRLLRKALNDYTAQLPEVPFFEKIGNVIGKNTVEAILSGTDRGILELVKGLVYSIKRELKTENCSIWLTGGDSDFFLRHIPHTIDAGKDFTLKGIGLIYKQGNVREK